jgi:stage III sporulation protein AD
MVEKISAILCLCILASVMCRLIGKYNKEQEIMLAAAVCTVILCFVLLYISPVLGFIEELCRLCSVDEKYTLILFKSLGICYITRFACDICKDCGETAVASVAEVSGKTALLVISLPLLEDLVDFVQRLGI